MKTKLRLLGILICGFTILGLTIWLACDVMADLNILWILR